MSKRNNPSTDMTKVGGDAPDWLATIEDESTLAMVEYRVLSRLKVVQSMSAESLKEEFGEGSIIISPGNSPVVPKRESVLLVPVFFFTEFCHWSDRNDNASATILGRSYDPKSEIAQKARDPEARMEPYGDGDYKSRYVEHLNFASIIYDREHPQFGTPVVLGFQRGEFHAGKNFISACLLRRVGGKQVPLWAQVWAFQTAMRDKGSKKWWGIDHSCPDIPYIQEDEAQFFQDQNKSIREDFEAQKLRVDHDDEDRGDPEDVDLEGSEL